VLEIKHDAIGWEPGGGGSRILRRKQLRHRVTRGDTKFAIQAAVFDVTIGLVKATRCLGAAECAPHIASFCRPVFECAQQHPTDPSEPRIRRHIAQYHFSDGENCAMLDSYQPETFVLDLIGPLRRVSAVRLPVGKHGSMKPRSLMPVLGAAAVKFQAGRSPL